jgi:hypothetical protein
MLRSIKYIDENDNIKEVATKGQYTTYNENPFSTDDFKSVCQKIHSEIMAVINFD